MNQTIKDWAKDDRPREKLIANGAASISNAELLAILINSGSSKGSALDLAKELLGRYDNKLNLLARLSVQEILAHKIPGIGPAKAVTIHAALSLSTRKELEGKSRQRLVGSKTIAAFLAPHMAHLQREAFMAVYLNNAMHVVQHKVVSYGGLTETTVDVRVIIKLALQYNAVAIIIAHNHPSGSLTPSQQDIAITESIIKAARTMNLEVVDHIIISDHGFFSFSDHNLLK